MIDPETVMSLWAKDVVEKISNLFNKVMDILREALKPAIEFLKDLWKKVKNFKTSKEVNREFLTKMGSRRSDSYGKPQHQSRMITFDRSRMPRRIH